MKKSNLKLGQVVELANGGRYLVTSINGSLILLREDGYMRLTDYEENLTKRIEDDYSIVKVFNIKPGIYGQGIRTIKNPSCLELVWERVPKKTKLEENREILSLLSKIIENHPDWRFHQILINFNIEDLNKDLYYEESTETLNTLKNELDID